MIRLSDTVKHLVMINVIVFLVVNFLLPNFLPWESIYSFTRIYSPDTGLFKPYQIVTSIFNHADFRHLLFNMLGLVFLGVYVEQTLGPKRFLTLYLLAGLASTLPAFLLTNYAALGASGAVLGVVMAFAAMFPNMKLMLLFPPIPVKAKYIALALIAYDVFFGFGGAQTGIGHFAHLAGAVVGFLLVVFWGKLNLR